MGQRKKELIALEECRGWSVVENPRRIKLIVRVFNTQYLFFSQ